MNIQYRQTLRRVVLVSALMCATYATPSLALVATAQATLDFDSILDSLSVEALRGSPVLTWVPETFQSVHAYAQQSPPGDVDSDGVVSGPAWTPSESQGATANANANASIDSAGQMTVTAGNQLGTGDAVFVHAASTGKRQGHFEITGGDARVTFQGSSFVALAMEGETVVDGKPAQGLATAFASLYLSRVGASSDSSNYLLLDVVDAPSSIEASELLVVTMDFMEGSTGYFEAVTNTWVALNVQPVPVPPALWLFGAAVASTVSVARKRRLR